MATTDYREQDWYDTPLYYDIVFEEDTHVEGSFLETMAARYGRPEGRRCLEPACGSGRLVAEMARRDWRVIGFDLSDAMLKFARRRLREAGLRGTLRQARMESFEFKERFDLAHCLVSTFKYLLDEESAEAHLRTVAHHLHLGGIYVLGFHLSDYTQTGRSRERWVGERDGVKVTCNIQSWPPDVKTRLEKCRSRLLIERGGRVQRQETHWDFRTYNARQFRALLREIPEFEHVATYDFTYDLRRKRRFDDRQLDNVVILRRVEA